MASYLVLPKNTFHDLERRVSPKQFDAEHQFMDMDSIPQLDPNVFYFYFFTRFCSCYYSMVFLLISTTVSLKCNQTSTVGTTKNNMFISFQHLSNCTKTKSTKKNKNTIKKHLQNPQLLFHHFFFRLFEPERHDVQILGRWSRTAREGRGAARGGALCGGRGGALGALRHAGGGGGSSVAAGLVQKATVLTCLKRL